MRWTPLLPYHPTNYRNKREKEIRVNEDLNDCECGKTYEKRCDSGCMSVNCKRIDKNDRNVNKDVNDWGEILTKELL